jgi:hypothetical protein
VQLTVGQTPNALKLSSTSFFKKSPPLWLYFFVIKICKIEAIVVAIFTVSKKRDKLDNRLAVCLYFVVFFVKIEPYLKPIFASACE